MALTDTINRSDSKYTSDEARRVIEDHLEQIRNASRLVTVDGVLTTKNHSNLYGLYAAINIPRSLWWITTRVNRFTYKTDIWSLTHLAVPQLSYVEGIIKASNARTTTLA